MTQIPTGMGGPPYRSCVSSHITFNVKWKHGALSNPYGDRKLEARYLDQRLVCEPTKRTSTGPGVT